MFEPQTEFEVENLSKMGFTQPTAVSSESKKGKKKISETNGKFVSTPVNCNCISIVCRA